MCQKIAINCELTMDKTRLIAIKRINRLTALILTLNNDQCFSVHGPNQN